MEIYPVQKPLQSQNSSSSNLALKVMKYGGYFDVKLRKTHQIKHLKELCFKFFEQAYVTEYLTAKNLPFNAETARDILLSHYDTLWSFVDPNYEFTKDQITDFLASNFQLIQEKVGNIFNNKRVNNRNRTQVTNTAMTTSQELESDQSEKMSSPLNLFKKRRMTPQKILTHSKTPKAYLFQQLDKKASSRTRFQSARKQFVTATIPDSTKSSHLQLNKNLRFTRLTSTKPTQQSSQAFQKQSQELLQLPDENKAFYFARQAESIDQLLERSHNCKYLQNNQNKVKQIKNACTKHRIVTAEQCKSPLQKQQMFIDRLQQEQFPLTSQEQYLISLNPIAEFKKLDFDLQRYVTKASEKGFQKPIDLPKSVSFVKDPIQAQINLLDKKIITFQDEKIAKKKVQQQKWKIQDLKSRKAILQADRDLQAAQQNEQIGVKGKTIHKSSKTLNKDSTVQTNLHNLSPDNFFLHLCDTANKTKEKSSMQILKQLIAKAALTKAKTLRLETQNTLKEEDFKSKNTAKSNFIETPIMIMTQSSVRDLILDEKSSFQTKKLHQSSSKEFQTLQQKSVNKQTIIQLKQKLRSGENQSNKVTHKLDHETVKHLLVNDSSHYEKSRRHVLQEYFENSRKTYKIWSRQKI